MKVRNDGATRTVSGFGLVNAGVTVEVDDETGKKLVAIPGFLDAEMLSNLPKDEEKTHACDQCENRYSTKSSLNRHKKTHGDD